MKVKYPITLDVKKTNVQKVIHANQGEGLDRKLIITLVSGNETILLDNENQSVQFVASKPDGTTVYNATKIKDGKVIVYLTTQTTAAAGDVDCQLEVVSTDEGSVGSGVVYSAKFAIAVEEALYSEEEIESSNEFGELIELIERAEKQVTVFSGEGEPDTDPEVYDEIKASDWYFDSTNKVYYYAAAVSTTIEWKRIYNKGEIDAKLYLKADKETTYTKDDVDTAFATKTNKVFPAVLNQNGSLNTDITNYEGIKTNDIIRALDKRVWIVTRKSGSSLTVMLCRNLFTISGEPVNSTSGNKAYYEGDVVVSDNKNIYYCSQVEASETTPIVYTYTWVNVSEMTEGDYIDIQGKTVNVIPGFTYDSFTLDNSNVSETIDVSDIKYLQVNSFTFNNEENGGIRLTRDSEAQSALINPYEIYDVTNNETVTFTRDVITGRTTSITVSYGLCEIDNPLVTKSDIGSLTSNKTNIFYGDAPVGNIISIDNIESIKVGDIYFTYEQGVYTPYLVVYKRLDQTGKSAKVAPLARENVIVADDYPPESAADYNYQDIPLGTIWIYPDNEDQARNMWVLDAKEGTMPNTEFVWEVIVTKRTLDYFLAGKQNKIDSTHKLDADNVDDTNSTNKFVSSAEKAAIGKEPKYELIKTINISQLSEPVSMISITEDEQGNAFAYDDILVDLGSATTSAANSKIAIDTYANGVTNTCSTFSKTNALNTSSKTILYDIKRLNENIFKGSLGGFYNNEVKLERKNNSQTYTNKINRVQIYTDTTFAAGTLKVYGRRKY